MKKCLILLALASASARAERPPMTDSPKLCAALRGNGNLVITHFTALARLTEHYGLMDGLAGGSSATISMFLYESAALNPLVAGGDAPLNMALLLKSVKQYITAIVTETDEALAVRGLAPIAARVKKEGVKALLDLHPIEAAYKLRTILSSDDLRDLINPEVIAMLSDVPHLARNAQEVYEAITGFGSFTATDQLIFFRPGVLSFEGLAGKIGRMGSFYAGYGPFDRAGFAAFFAACGGESTRGASWEAIARKPAGNGRTCDAAFTDLVLTYRKKLVAAEATTRSRLDDAVGAHLHAAVALAVLDGTPTLASYTGTLAAYRKGEPLAFRPHFTDVRYGYFANAADGAAIMKNARGYQDLKTAKRLALAPLPWRQVLALSPAEPGLARLKDLPGGKVSAAGWPDLHPVQTLKNMGCEKVVYVTRQGEDSKFGRGIAKLLGATAADESALYDLDAKDSSFSQALGAADAVWCTNWDSFKDAEIDLMADDAYAAPLQTRDPFFAAGPHPYLNRVETTAKRGCAAGATAPLAR